MNVKCDPTLKAKIQCIHIGKQGAPKTVEILTERTTIFKDTMFLSSCHISSPCEIFLEEKFLNCAWHSTFISVGQYLSVVTVLQNQGYTQIIWHFLCKLPKKEKEIYKWSFFSRLLMFKMRFCLLDNFLCVYK